MADHESSSVLLKLIICLIAVASAAVVVTIYHCLTAGYPRRDRRIRRPEHDNPTSIDNSLAELLPAHRFRKGVDNGTCSICLCEFEEGEELRTLPECVHSFHSSCIDMWLYSHSNCPVCRTGVGNFGHFDSPMLVQLLHSSSPQPAVMIQVINSR